MLRASSDLAAPGEVEWWWNESASSLLAVESVDEPSGLVFTWHGHRVGHRTRVELSLEARDDGATHARFRESGWEDDEAGRASAFSHAEAWTELLAATEAWLVHGVSIKPRRS